MTKQKVKTKDVEKEQDDKILEVAEKSVPTKPVRRGDVASGVR